MPLHLQMNVVVGFLALVVHRVQSKPMRGAIVYLLSLLIGLAAAAGLAWLVIENPPTRPNVALAIVLLVAAATGLLAPLLAWLHRLIPFGGRPPVRRAAFRQAFFIGLALALAALLILVDLLDATLLLGILALVVLLEWLAQTWHPSSRGR